MSRPVESYLRDLIALCDDPPLIHELTAEDLGTSRGTSSIARAALCWYRDGLEEELRHRLEEELRQHDLLARFRVRAAGLDVHQAADLLGTDFHGRPLTWGRRPPTPIAELQRLRQYGTEAVA